MNLQRNQTTKCLSNQEGRTKGEGLTTAKHEGDPLRDDFDTWVAGDKPVGRKPAIFHLLICRLREMCG